MAFREDEDVGAAAAGQAVVTGSAIDVVAASTAIDRVVAVAAEEPFRMVTAEVRPRDRVVAAAAEQPGALPGRGNYVVAAAADHVLPVALGREGVGAAAAQDDVEVAPGAGGVRAAAQVEDLDAVAALDVAIGRIADMDRRRGVPQHARSCDAVGGHGVIVIGHRSTSSSAPLFPSLKQSGLRNLSHYIG